MGWVDELDERSDLFSLGGILYAILTLRPPVEGQALDEVLNRITSGEITDPSQLQASARENGGGGFGPWHECPLAFGRGIWKSIYIPCQIS